jgi:hypothetical protein
MIVGLDVAKAKLVVAVRPSRAVDSGERRTGGGELSAETLAGS